MKADDEFLRVLSDDTPMAECARTMICSRVLSFGGLKQVKWDKREIVTLDQGPPPDYSYDDIDSHQRYIKDHRWILTVLVEVDVPRAIKKVKVSDSGDEAESG